MGTYLRMTPALRGVLTNLVSIDEATWGLRLAKAVGRPTGTIYPTLERLEREGFVSSRWDDEDRPGARRRLYELTPTGRAWAQQRLGAVTERRSEPERRPHGHLVLPQTRTAT